MKTVGVRICVSALTLLGMAMAATESHAAGIATSQQVIAQVQSTLSEASVGWRRCCGYGFRRGWGYGFAGYGYGGYYGYGYPYGYGGYAFARPVIYSYPSYYGYRSYPSYYSGYSYGAPCCGYSYSAYQPATYNVSSYSYPTQSVVYSPSVYTSSTVPGVPYGTPTYSSGGVYQPSYYSPTVISRPSYISTPTTVYPSSNGYSAPAAIPAPYPAPPAEYGQPSVNRSPVAVSPVQTATMTPFYRPSVAQTALPQHAAYAPSQLGLGYSPATATYQLASYNIVW
jgi:hypothetical protein